MHLANEDTELPLLTQQELGLLDTWLRGLKPNLSFFYVHGFLCAVLTTPVEIPPTEWFPAMLVPNIPYNFIKNQPVNWRGDKPFLQLW